MFDSCRDAVHGLNTTIPTLTYLEVYSKDHIHLDKLPPSLQKLIILTSSGKWNCENNLPHLQTFDFVETRSHARFENLGAGHLKFQRILPFNSKSTLTRFASLIPDHPPSKQYLNDVRHLMQFFHLTDLAIRPLTREMRSVLLHSSLRLQIFATRSLFEDKLHTGALLDLLNSPVLRNLESFEYDYANYPVPIYRKSFGIGLSSRHPKCPHILNVKTVDLHGPFRKPSITSTRLRP